MPGCRRHRLAAARGRASPSAFAVFGLIVYATSRRRGQLGMQLLSAAWDSDMRTAVLARARCHPFILRRLILAGLLCLIIAAGLPKSAMAQPSHNDTKLEEVEEIIGNFIGFVSSRRLDSAVKILSALGTHFDNDQIKKLILSLDIMGESFYSDKIIDRLYGKTGKDLIFKITTDNNIYFFRFILHKRAADNWVVTWFGVQTESQAPLPRVWSHATPE